jgi:large subunit ribosomal protein L21
MAEAETKKKTTKTAKTQKSTIVDGKKPFAVISTGGKQYVVSAGDILKIEKMKGEFKSGDKINFDQVLFSDNGSESTFGAPFISGGKVAAELIEEGRNKKIVVIKYKQKSRYFKKNGHKQPYFKVKINSI